MTSARAFVDVLLPAMLLELAPLCARVQAIVALHITGEHDDVACTITLDATPTIEGGAHDADVTLAIDESLLDALLAGTLDVDTAFDEGLIDAEGDLSALSRFADVLSKRASPLSTRLNAMMGRTT